MAVVGTVDAVRARRQHRPLFQRHPRKVFGMGGWLPVLSSYRAYRALIRTSSCLTDWVRLRRRIRLSLSDPSTG